MSEYLFVGDGRRVPTPSRQRSLVFASIVVHAAIVVVLLIVSILLPDVLPTPHIAMAWSAPRLVQLADIPLPPHRETVRPLQPVTAPTTPAVPLDAPDGIAPEPERASAFPPMQGFVDGPPVATLGEALAPVVAPPPPPPAQTAPLRLSSGIATPVKIHDVLPEYPALARSARAQGVVIIEATIDTDGHVVAARVLRSVPLLDDAALQAVGQWQYTPAQLNGQPVSVLMTVTVRFALDR
jgi:protein TonB